MVRVRACRGGGRSAGRLEDLWRLSEKSRSLRSSLTDGLGGIRELTRRAFICSKGAPQIPPLPPGIPVKFNGVDEFHAAFLTESRTREHVWHRGAGISGTVGMTKGRGAITLKNG
jgi:hypothetical protein